MTYVNGPQFGVKHTLIGPDGTVAVFNDDTDPNYVGVLTNASGFDSPEVRESAADLVEMDGGIHGAFYYSRRAVVLEGLIRASSAEDRNLKATILQRASNAVRADAQLKWTPDGGIEQFLYVRRQSRLAIEGGFNKSFQLPLVASDPRIYSTSLLSVQIDAAGSGSVGRSYPRVYPIDYGGSTAAGQGNVINEGSHQTPPLLRLDGPLTNPAIRNVSTDQTITLTYSLASGEYLEIDTANHTVILNGTTDRYSAIDFANTDWFYIEPGTNDIRLLAAAYSAPAKLTVSWRYAWV